MVGVHCAHGTSNQSNRNDKIRYIFGLKRSDHVSEYRECLCGLTPESRAKLHSAVLIYNSYQQFSKQSPVESQS